jgi:hypothetical protein
MPKKGQKIFLSRVARLTMLRTEGMLDRQKEHRPHASSFLNGEDWSEAAEKEIES